MPFRSPFQALKGVFVGARKGTRTPNTQVTEIYCHLSLEVMDRAMGETFGDE